MKAAKVLDTTQALLPLLPPSFSSVAWAWPGLGWAAVSSPSQIGPVLGFLAEEIENRDYPIICDIIIIFTIIVNNDGCYLFHVCILQTQC